MPLSQAVLKANILKVFNEANASKDKEPGPPNIPTSLADKFADAYDQYAAGAKTIGPLAQIVPGLKTGLAGSLNLPMFAGWGPGLIAYWAPVQYAGPGFIPVNPVAPSQTAAFASIITELGPTLFKDMTDGKKSAADAADKIATILHKYTLKLMVTTTTTSAPPVIATVPVL